MLQILKVKRHGFQWLVRALTETGKTGAVALIMRKVAQMKNEQTERMRQFKKQKQAMDCVWENQYLRFLITIINFS